MVLRTIFIIIVIYLIYGFFLFFMQKNIIYHPAKQDFYDCKNFSDVQKVEHKGTRMYYKQNSEKLVIFYHGNAGSVCDRKKMKEIMEKLNVSYIFVEYAGYSNDKVGPSKKRILQDVRNVNDFIKKIKHKELIIMGKSLGSGPASFHTTISKADKLLLIAPFSSIADVARRSYFLYPVKLILTENYDNVEWLRNFKGKVMIMHSGDDEVIPIKLAKKLYENIKTEKEFVEIRGKHNFIFDDTKTEESIKRFIYPARN